MKIVRYFLPHRQGITGELQCGADAETQATAAMASHCNNTLIRAGISSIAAARSRQCGNSLASASSSSFENRPSS